MSESDRIALFVECESEVAAAAERITEETGERVLRIDLEPFGEGRYTASIVVALGGGR
jgi:hypothetical protein